MWRVFFFLTKNKYNNHISPMVSCFIIIISNCFNECNYFYILNPSFKKIHLKFCLFELIQYSEFIWLIYFYHFFQKKIQIRSRTKTGWSEFSKPLIKMTGQRLANPGTYNLIIFLCNNIIFMFTIKPMNVGYFFLLLLSTYHL